MMFGITAPKRKDVPIIIRAHGPVKQLKRSAYDKNGKSWYDVIEYFYRDCKI